MVSWIKSNIKTISITLGILLSLVLGFAYYIFLFPNYYDDPKGKIVTISRGATFKIVVDSLVNTGTIHSRWAFQFAGRLLGYANSVKIGKYLFTSGSSNLDILTDISLGKSRMIIPVTIPEGWRIEKIVRRFGRDLGIDTVKMISYCRDANFIHQQGIDAQLIEGYLLPETYSFYWQTDEQEILVRILDAFKKFYSDSLVKRQIQLKMSQKDILTLASIIEAESSVDEERPTISGVYWNRLKQGMRLEADPTIQYALGENRRLTFDDLTVASPFNTYRRHGLPPGPINNPGKSAILAALFPEEHNYLFFVAKGNGGHHFARNYSDHQKNIRLYHRVRREMQRRAG